MTEKQIPIAININFDSFNEALGFPDKFNDPCFFEGADYIFNLANKYGVRLSLFMVGKDLENPEFFARVRDWSTQGHEIGNHTWSHPVNLGTLHPLKIKSQIEKCHDIVTKCTKIEPKGFIAPAWSTSSDVNKILMDLGYDYDTSVFSSMLMYPLILKMVTNNLKNFQKVRQILSRKDYLNGIFQKPYPYYINDSNNSSKKILEMPIPRYNFLLSYWHTIGFMLGWEYAEKILNNFLINNNYFYYLLHPADYVSLPPKYTTSLERMKITQAEKRQKLEKMFSMMVNSKRPIMTMSSLARYYKKTMVQ